MNAREIMDEEARNLEALMRLHNVTVNIMPGYWFWIWIASFMIAIPIAGVFFYRLGTLMELAK